MIAGDTETKVQVVIPRISLDGAKVSMSSDQGRVGATISFLILPAYE